MSNLFTNLISDLKSDRKALWIFGIGIALILVLGVGMMVVIWDLVSQPSPSQTNPEDVAMLFTQAVETVLAELTQQVIINPLTTLETPTPILESSSTLSPTSSITIQEPTPSFASSLTPSSHPPTPTRIIPSLTLVTVKCNSALFVRDVTVMDNTPFTPDTFFVKTWRIKNTGSCTWTQDYSLVFVSGNAMGAKQSVALPAKVAPDQTIDISINMTSPKNAGTYRGDWILSSSNGVRFGTGSSSNETLYVSIKVKDLTNPSLVYDFSTNYCKAKWQSGAGVLPCPGTSSGSEGFITLLDTPKLESRQEDELALLTHPQTVQNGWISGIYPPFTIQSGHHFIAWVGCLGESKGCNVTFRLDFINTKNGQVKNLGVWEEIYDGNITKIDLNLDQHAEKNVQFIMTVDITGGDPGRANAFWFVPGIVQGISPSSTPTPFPTNTPTPTQSHTPTSTPTQSTSQQEVVKLALTTLATDLGIDPSSLDLILVRYAEWTDSCLELPKGSETCQTILTPGYRIIVTYNRTIYEIHTSQDGSNIRWTTIKINSN